MLLIIIKICITLSGHLGASLHIEESANLLLLLWLWPCNRKWRSNLTLRTLESKNRSLIHRQLIIEKSLFNVTWAPTSERCPLVTRVTILWWEATEMNSQPLSTLVTSIGIWSLLRTTISSRANFYYNNKINSLADNKISGTTRHHREMIRITKYFQLKNNRLLPWLTVV